MQVWKACRHQTLGRPSNYSNNTCKARQHSTLTTYSKDQLGFPPCWDLVLSLLRACTLKRDLAAGKHLHLLLASHGLDAIPFCADGLIRLFALSGSLRDAHRAFTRVSKPSLYTWNAIISAHVMLGTPETLFALYNSMLQCSFLPDRVMLLSLLKVCDIPQGMVLHHQIVSCGLESDSVIASTLVDVNAKNGALREAYKVFKQIQNRDVVTWGALMTGYIQHGYCLAVLELFDEMRLEGIDPDRVIFLCLLKACSHIGSMVLGRLVHGELMSCRLETDLSIGNTLIDMYARCGSVEEAYTILERLHKRDAVSWSALIAGYAQHGYNVLIFRNFKRMQEEGTKPNKVTYLCLLKACINLAALAQGWLIHEHIIRRAFDSDLEVGNSLIDLYAKCGLPNEAYKVFVRLPKRDIVSWGALLAGYAQVGNLTLVLHFLKDMTSQSLMPNDVIFTSIFAACSRAGRIEEAQRYFEVMIECYSIVPNLEHYSCLIDLFGRTGCVNEAQRFFEILPLRPDAVAWKSLLTSCRTHGNIDLGRHCFEQAVQLDTEDATTYVLMSRLYEDAHLWEDANKFQEMRRSAHAWKVPGKAWLEVDRELFEFIMGGRDHEESDQIYGKFDRLGKFLKKDGHVPLFDAITLGGNKEDSSTCKASLQVKSG
eukprot:c22439_g1_i1 orf=435-2396(+)